MINFMVYDTVENMKNKFTYDGNVIIETFVKEYLKKFPKYEFLYKEEYVFKIGAKILNSNKYLSKKLNECIKDGSEIHLVKRHMLGNGLQPLNEILKEKQNDRNFGYYIDYFSKEQKNPSEWKAIIEGPKGSIYEGGFYMIKIIFPSEYYQFPYESKPYIYFMNKIFHPKIYQGSIWDGNCCVRILKTDIETILQTIENMLIDYNENIEYAYNEEPRQLLIDKKEGKFIEKAKTWVQEFAKFKDVLKYIYM